MHFHTLHWQILPFQLYVPWWQHGDGTIVVFVVVGVVGGLNFVVVVTLIYMEMYCWNEKYD